jgi:hypothetical protein
MLLYFFDTYRERKFFLHLTCIMLWMTYSLYTRRWIMNQLRKFPWSRASNVPSNTWFDAVFIYRFLAVAWLSVIRFLHYTAGWKTSLLVALVCAGTQVKDHHARCSQAPGMKIESSKAVSRDFRKNECARCQSISHFPVSDYNKVPPKVGTSGSIPKDSFRDETVSGVVTYSMFQI